MSRFWKDGLLRRMFPKFRSSKAKVFAEVVELVDTLP